MIKLENYLGITLGWAFIMFTGTIKADNSESLLGKMTTEISTSQSEIMPYESVKVHVIFTNPLNTPQTVAVSHTSFMSIFIKYGENGKWERYNPWARGVSLIPTPPRKTTVPPRGVFKEGDTQLHLNSGENPIFVDPGNYWIKIVSCFGETEPIRISVKEPLKDEKEVLEYIKSNKLYLWTTKDDVSMNYYKSKANSGLDTNYAQKKFSGLIQRFTKSYYSEWAKKVLAWIEDVKKAKIDDSME